MARTRGAATLRDIAELVGVSQATVSLVLNAVPGSRISADTRARVLAAADELGYRRNATGAHLRKGDTQLVAFIGDEVATSPFAGEIIEGAQEQAWADGRLLLVVNTGGDRDFERRAIEALLERRVTGVVYAAMYHRQVTLPAALEAVPTVLLNAFADDEHAAVVPDETEGGCTATDLLADLGHRRIGFINVNSLESGLPAAVGRHAGYRRSLERHGVPFEPELVGSGYGNTEDGYRETRRFLTLSEPPTAIFAGNDRTAWGVYQALTEAGLRVPDDVSVVGFDNQELIAAHLRPTLSTVALPFAAMGRLAVELLGEGQEPTPGVHRVPCPLVERDSVAAPARRPA